MDLLWKTPEFSARDIKTLTFNEGEECKVIYGPSTKVSLYYGQDWVSSGQC